MSQYPNDPSQAPNREYTGYGSTPQNPYGVPQGPYSTPPTQEYGASQWQNYPPPPQAYAPPPQGYAPPLQGYGPPPQGTYGAPPEYGYGAPYQGPGYAPPFAQSSPLPLSEAIRQLPKQYIKVLTKPSAQTFAEEMGKAKWDIVWVQLIGYAIIATLLLFLSTYTNFLLYNPTGLSSLNSGTSGIDTTAVLGLVRASIFASIITIPIGYFISVGIYYLIAKAFGGDGSYLRQMYTTLLFQVPIGLVTSLFVLIPFVSYLGSLVGIYAIVLNVFNIMAVHRLSGGKATLVVLLPIIVGVLLVCILGFALVALIVGALRSAHP